MKQGFDHLETLLNETMANTPGHTVPTKISKAGLLMKAKDTIIRHQMEKKRKQQEIDLLRRECENLQQQISCAQVRIFVEIKEENKNLRNSFQKRDIRFQKCAAIRTSASFYSTSQRERSRTTNSFRSIWSWRGCLNRTTKLWRCRTRQSLEELVKNGSSILARAY